MYSGFYGYTLGNQGTYTARTDNALIDIDLYNPANGATGGMKNSGRYMLCCVQITNHRQSIAACKPHHRCAVDDETWGT